MAYMKSGSPFLYDNTTGDIVGIKDADGGDSFFASHSSISNITYNANGTVNTYVKNGATYTVSYNANGFVSLISGTDGHTYTPAYDNNFRVTGVVVA